MALDATILAALLQSCAPNVAPASMAAIIQVESEGQPYRIGINSGAILQRQPTNAADAIATARGLLRRGANFDAGLMQINSANFARLGLSPETVFDPCTNLRAGAAVLTDNYMRAHNDGHPNPLLAALSEYNTGSRSRGMYNGYVRKVFAAAGSTIAPAATAIRPAAMRVSYGSLTPNYVGNLLVSAFGGRITDTLRPMNARYGAENSYHKYGQAVDFVPRGGMGAIDREQIRALMAANGIEIIELLGPGDRDHDDHWHVAFASLQGAPAPALPQAPWSVAVQSAVFTNEVAQAGAFQVAASLVPVDGAGTAPPDADPAPPAWDVFALAAWQKRQMPAPVEGGL